MDTIETNLRECVGVLKQQLGEAADETATVRRHLLRQESENRRLREVLNALADAVAAEVDMDACSHRLGNAVNTAHELAGDSPPAAGRRTA